MADEAPKQQHQHAPTTAADDKHQSSDLDPAAFLESISQLKSKREQEDNERLRRLEAEIEKGRQERAARRAERERSLSPEKADGKVTNSDPKGGFASSPNRTPLRGNASLVPTYPSATPPPSNRSTTASGVESTTPKMSSALEQKRASAVAEEVPEFKGFGSLKKKDNPITSGNEPPTTEKKPEMEPSPSPPLQSASTLARSGTLSWQQRRPASRPGGSRPMSMASAAIEQSKEEARPASRISSELSRDQIAASLGARDPAWFKQTADRGVGSAAYRKSKDEVVSPRDMSSSGRRQLPGLSRETSAEPSRDASPAASESIASTRDTSATGSTGASTITASNRFSANTTVSSGSKEDGTGRTLPMSSSQAKLAGGITNRAASPTKGMGGFVQSAMMKRSDSVNKRWSQQQQGPGGSSLSRSNSVVSQRSGYGGLQASHSMPKLEPAVSGHSHTEGLTTESKNDDVTGIVKPELPRHHSRSKSSASNFNNDKVSSDPDSAVSPPTTSPSKRWSPTKSSWLESALGKPETLSRPASPSKPSQPDWMANIAKVKAQRQSQDITPKSESLAGKDGEAVVPLRSRSPTKGTPFGPSLVRNNNQSPGIGSEIDVASSIRPTTPLAKREPQVVNSNDKPEHMNSKTTVPVDEQESLKKIETPTPPSKPAALKEVPLVPTNPTSKLSTSNNDAGSELVVSIKTSLSTDQAAVKPQAPSVKEIKSSKPETPPKKDFRSNLRPRGPSEPKAHDEPEFKSVFGTLRKTRTENFVAPDTFGENIRRGKTGLNTTGGPQKSVIKNEFKDSIMAKKDDMKAKAADPEHKRQGSQQAKPDTPTKPEALARRDLLGRSKTVTSKDAPAPEEKPDETPEALRRHRTIRSKPDVPKLASKPTGMVQSPPISTRSVDAKGEPQPPVTAQEKQPMQSIARSPSPPPVTQTESSKLAARFNPGLAGILARGPPTSSGASVPGSRSESPAGRPPIAKINSSGEAPSAENSEAPLQDMRKGRARGPKKRKQADKTSAPQSKPSIDMESKEALPTPALKPAKSVQTNAKPTVPSTGGIAVAVAAAASKSLPSTPAMSPALLPRLTKDIDSPAGSPMVSSVTTNISKADSIPDFKGFGSANKASLVSAGKHNDDDKENSYSSDGPPAIKSLASRWGSQSQEQPTENKPLQRPEQIQLPTKKDEEAAMKSAGLLSSPSTSIKPSPMSSPKIKALPTSPGTSTSFPPKPAKSSRSVSGQLQGAPSSKDQVISGEAEARLFETFGRVPTSNASLTIDTQSLLNQDSQSTPNVKSSRKSVQEFLSESNIETLPPQEEYTFFDESIYICTQSGMTSTGGKMSQVFVWAGESSASSVVEQAQAIAKKQPGSTGPVLLIKQGKETIDFLNALGGILVTRRGSRTNASKQYMLCGRKHLGRIVFDEVDFAVSSLCSGFVYLLSWPLKLQQTRLYLWKGSACSAEELSAARLAAMDLSETGEIVEVDDGVEFNSFLSIFGPGTNKTILKRKPSEIWKMKSKAPAKFRTKLFKLGVSPNSGVGIVGGLLGGMFTRRPSWQGQSGTDQDKKRADVDIRVEPKDINPFSQSDLEAEGIYLLDAYGEVYVLIGPLFASSSSSSATRQQQSQGPQQQQQHQDGIQSALLAQTLLFAADYALLAAGLEDRPGVPKGYVLFAGVPEELKNLFRGWEDSRGLWGTGELMAGWRSGKGTTAPGRAGSDRRGKDVELVGLEETLGAVCKR